ncbi:Rha family transcriptional regulator [uncultured Acinetobacter sp.]|uniref:Rha family transcriptional regulator n=1 Tax=uncultured Acinetobacter sp. TaxID=165433 RepID=UPI00258F3F29|nr:Rha family transcriptional regulator [uncultured Acinetobacter sp.]
MNANFNPIVKLVDVQKGQPTTTTLQIALGLRLTHKSVIQLLRTYLPDIQEFGKVRFESSYDSNGLSNSAFEMPNSGLEIRNSNQGRHTRYAILNEQQAYFLMTLMRNNPRVISFKKALVRAFFEARTLLQTDYFSLVQKREALNAKLECEKDIASACGRGLSQWKKQRDVLETAIANVDRQIQPCLFENLN